MSVIKFQSDETLYFQDEGQFYDYINSSIPNSIRIESFDEYLSSLTPNDIFNISNRIINLFDGYIMKMPITELIIFECDLDDDWELLICSKEKLKNETVSVINKVSEFYNRDFKAVKVDSLFIAVVDPDNACLQNEYNVTGSTLWYNVDEFINDTQYHANYYHSDTSIETYEEAVDYWEKQYWKVISNYVKNIA